MEDSGYVYHCSTGESFDSIALEMYGDEKYAAELMCFNPEYIGTYVFAGGEELYLPLLDTDDAESDTAPWKE